MAALSSPGRTATVTAPAPGTVATAPTWTPRACARSCRTAAAAPPGRRPTTTDVGRLSAGVRRTGAAARIELAAAMVRVPPAWSPNGGVSAATGDGAAVVRADAGTITVTTPAARPRATTP